MHPCSVQVMSWIITQGGLFEMLSSQDIPMISCCVGTERTGRRGLLSPWWKAQIHPCCALTVHTHSQTRVCVCVMYVLAFSFFRLDIITCFFFFFRWSRKSAWLLLWKTSSQTDRQTHLDASGGASLLPWAVAYLGHGRCTEGTNGASKSFQASTKVRSHQLIWLTIPRTRLGLCLNVSEDSARVGWWCWRTAPGWGNGMQPAAGSPRSASHQQTARPW